MKGQRDDDDVELNYIVRWETPLEILKKTHLLLEIFISLRVVSLEKLSGKSLSWLMLIIIEIKGVILIKMNEGQFFVISRWNMIIRVSIILNRTVVVDSDWRFDNLCCSHLQRQSELYYVNWWYFKKIWLLTLLVNHVIGRLSVKPWWFWMSLVRFVYCHQLTWYNALWL